MDAPGRPDPDIGPDVVVHVFTGALRTPDMRVLTNAPRGSTVAVLDGDAPPVRQIVIS